MANSPSSRSIGELRHGVLGSADAIAQSLALLALVFAVSAAPASAAATAGAAVPLAFVIAGVYSLWIALGLLIAGLIILAVLVVTRPDRVRSFGRAFETSGHS